MASSLPALVGGRYRPVGLLGKGGMGVVYEAEHVRTGARVALKVLHQAIGESETLVTRFMREARASSVIKSEHVVRVTDADVAPELEGAPFLVMDLLEGSDLERLTGDEPQPIETVVGWLRDVSRGLDKAHAVGIVHRDLKPDNLFLTHREDGTPIVKILDFGIAKVAADAGLSTQSGQILGTPRYMAPEQARGESNVGPHTDLFALGLIAFRLLAGKPYFDGDSMAQLMTQLIVDPMRAPSTLSPKIHARFDAWFARACSRDPAARFPGACEQTEALAEALGLPRQLPVAMPTPPAARGVAGVTALESAETVEARSVATNVSGNRRLLAAFVVVACAAAAVVVVLRGGASPGGHASAPAGTAPVASVEPIAPAPVAQVPSSASIPAASSATVAPVASAPTVAVAPPGTSPGTRPTSGPRHDKIGKPAAAPSPKADPLADQK